LDSQRFDHRTIGAGKDRGDGQVSPARTEARDLSPKPTPLVRTRWLGLGPAGINPIPLKGTRGPISGCKPTLCDSVTRPVAVVKPRGMIPAKMDRIARRHRPWGSRDTDPPWPLVALVRPPC
jgi:hypothetical protein